MFLPLSKIETIWKSQDGLVQAGFALLGDIIPVSFAWLGPREIVLSDIVGLQSFLTSLEAPRSDNPPLLLLSETPGFQPNVTDEASGLALEAARYRRLQQEYRDCGGQIISVARRIVVGGTYLVHGLAAPHRLVTSGSRIYGGLPPQASQAVLGEKTSDNDPALEDSLTEALKLGLFTEILPEDELSTRLKTLLSPSNH